MDYEAANGDRFEDDPPRNYDDRRSASPRNDDVAERRRSASPSNGDRSGPKDDDDRKESSGAYNPGSNLFVTGIHPRLVEAEVTRLFEKYGEVEKCQIMRDPHTKESRGFGFVKMVTTEQADAAIEGLQSEVVEGRTLSIEKARRNRPRTPTPGKYFGPPKREGERGGRGRFDDRRRGGGGYGGGRDDPYRYRGYDRRYDDREPRGYRDDRGYDRSGGPPPRDDRGYDRRDRDEGYGRGDRYRDDRDRFGGPRDDRRPPMDRERDRFDRDRDGPRSRDPPPVGGYGGDGPRGDSRDPYGSDRR